MRRWHEMLADNPCWLFHWLTYLQIVRRYYAIGWNPKKMWGENERKAELNSASQKDLLDFLFEENGEYGLRKHSVIDGPVARTSWWLDNLSGHLGGHESLARKIWEDLDASFESSHAKWKSSEQDIMSVRRKFRSFLRSARERNAKELFPWDAVEAW